MYIDLFKLHLPSEDSKSLRWIGAYGRNLNSKLFELLKEANISKYQLSCVISKEMNISNSTIQKMLYGRKFIPLIIIERILQEWKNRLNKTDEELITKKMKYKTHLNN